MKHFPVRLFNISESDGVMWGNTDDGEDVCVRGTYEYRDFVVSRDGTRAIPCGVFSGTMRAFPDQEYQVHFKNDCGMLIERPQHLELPVKLLRHCTSFAVLATPLGEQALIWQPGAVWDSRRGYFVGYLGSMLVCLRI